MVVLLLVLILLALVGVGRVLMWLLLGMVIFGAAACAPTGQGTVVVKEVPRLAVSCPDPAKRKMLGEGSTYRVLAEARLEAVAGWQQCHDALAISQR